MLKRISSSLIYARTTSKLAAFALASLSLGAVAAQAQEDLVIDDFSRGYVGEPVADPDNRYYSSPIPRWYYSSHSSPSNAEIATDASGDNYLLFTGAGESWSNTWVDRDSERVLNLSPAQPFQIDFDMLNTTGESEASTLLVHYLLNDRWTNMGAGVVTDPVGYRLQIRITGDTTVRYEVVAKGGGSFVVIPGTQGTATVAPGLLAVDGNPGRRLPVSLEIYQNQQKLSIDGVEMFDVDIDPLPQNNLFGNNGFVQVWSSAGTARGMDNILIRQFEAPEPEPWQPVVPGDLYWANTTMIRTAESDGSGARIVRDGFNRAIGVAIDEVNGKLYWTDGGAVHWSDLTGENSDTIYSGAGSTQGIAVDPIANRIYWAEFSSGLHTAELDGFDPKQIINVADYGATSGSSGVIVDSTTGDVYWSLNTTGDLVRGYWSGSEFQTETIATLPTGVYGLAMDAERERIYYTVFANPGTLNYLDLTTGEPTTLLEGLGQPLGVALTADGEGLFWAERIGGKITRAYIDEDGFIGGAQPVQLGEISPFFVALTSEAKGSPYFKGFVNGDFEEEPFDKGWSVHIGDKAKAHSGIAPGSNTAVYFHNDQNTRLVQYFPQWVPLIPTTGATEPSVVVVTDPATGEHRSEFFRGIGPKWQFGLHFAGGDPDGAGNRSLNLILGHVPPETDHQINLANINFRINGAGGAEAFNNSPTGLPTGWASVFPAGTFEPSEIVDGEFINPNVYYLQFDGDYSTDDPTYTVSARRAGESHFFAVSQPMRAWQYGAPPAGSGISMVHFHGFVQAPYVIDDLHLVAVGDGDVPEGYAGWASQHFSESELNDPTVSGPQADPDGDGIVNLLEYALGGLPREASRANLPTTGVVEVEGERYLTLTYTRPADAPDLAYQVEVSAEISGEPSDWVEGQGEETSSPGTEGTISVTYRDAEPIGESDRRFLRLRVSGE